MAKSLHKTGFQTVPTFIRGSQGQLFCVRSTLSEKKDHSRSPLVLLVPPFAEELNRSRRFFTKLRNSLMFAGAAEVVLPDLYGTGDSAGDFADASWQLWKEDLNIVVSRLCAEHRDRPLSVIGVRAGCLLIDELLRELDVQLGNVVYINPETDGFEVIHYLLRVRVASGRFSGSGSETTEELWRELDAGNAVEVSGYEINSTLASVLKKKKLKMELPTGACNGYWIELDDKLAVAQGGVVGTSDNNSKANDIEASPELTPPDTQKTLSVVDNRHWIDKRLEARPFWQLHEHEPDDETVVAIARCAVPVEQ